MLVSILLLVLGVGKVQAEQKNSLVMHLDFEGGEENEAPLGFSFARTGRGRPGRWVIKKEANAPSGAHVLAQIDPDATDVRFPIAVTNEPLLADLQLSVWCKPVAGAVDQACGLVFRYQDENNYYITRANALEQNVRFYRVVNGNRQQLAGWRGPVTGDVWHEMGVQAQADRFLVFWDGKQVIEAHDETFPNAGKVGVWTKADSVTYFDDLLVKPLNP